MAGSKPVLADLSQELDDLTWSEVTYLGVQLGMKFCVLQKIGDTKADSVRLLAAMDAWLQSDPKASWKKVVRALRAIRKEVLAQELEEKYCRDGGSEICVTAENDGSSAATVAEETSGSTTQPPSCETTTHHLPSNNPPAPQEKNLLTKLFEELLPAQNHSQFLGLTLGLDTATNQAIQSENHTGRDRLLQVLTVFLTLVDPAEAWEKVVAALKNPIVNLPRLATEIEERHCRHQVTNTATSPSPSATHRAPKTATTNTATRPSPSATHRAPKTATTNTATRPSPSATTHKATPTGPKLSDKPTLPKLFSFRTTSGGHINIAQKISGKCRRFSILLLDDEDGELTEGIFLSEKGEAGAVTERALAQWLQGTGLEPRSWKTLTNVLDLVGLTELADRVRENLT